MYHLIFFISVVFFLSLLVYRVFTLPKNAAPAKIDNVYMLINFCLTIPVLFLLHQTLFFSFCPASLYYLDNYVFMVMYVVMWATLDSMFSTSSMHYAKYLQAALVSVSLCVFLFPAVPTFYLLMSCASVVALQEFFALFIQDQAPEYWRICTNRFMAVPMIFVLGLLFEEVLFVRVCIFLGVGVLNISGLQYGATLYHKTEEMLSSVWLRCIHTADEKEEVKDCDSASLGDLCPEGLRL